MVTHRVLLGNVGSFATRAQQSTALERCRTGLRLREAVDVGGEGDLLFFFLYQAGNSESMTRRRLLIEVNPEDGMDVTTACARNRYSRGRK